VRHGTKEIAMAQRRLGLITLMLLVCAGLPACGTTGKTSTFVLTLDLPKGQTAGADIRIASAAVDANVAQFKAVNVRPWGKFGTDDLRNLEQSLRGTITAQRPATFRPTESRLDIHFVIRRYFVSVSNTGGAVLVCVVWAATEPQGKLVYQEQFYASEAVYFIGTIGLLKDSVHKAIIRRIATTSLALASDPAAASTRPTTFENTSTSFEEAAARLPKTMVSMGGPWLMASPFPVVTALGALIPSEIATVQWGVANPSDNFDWQGYLEKLYPRR
jgi:hypothetical protein